MGFRNILTKPEYEDLLANSKTYRRKIPVRAVQMDRRFSIETRDGVIVNGHPGDYVVQNTRGDARPWVITKEIFESSFEELTNMETQKEHARPKNKDADHGSIDHHRRR